MYDAINAHLFFVAAVFLTFFFSRSDNDVGLGLIPGLVPIVLIGYGCAFGSCLMVFLRVTSHGSLWTISAMIGAALVTLIGTSALAELIRPSRRMVID